MLSEIRERATGWIAWIIVGIISIPFAFWGVNEYFSGGEDVVVATVNGEEIQQVDYRQALDSRRAQMRRVLGDSFDPDIVNSPEFKRRVLDDLISRMLLDVHSTEQGYRISDQQLAGIIRSNPRFQQGESFSQDVYRTAVTRMGLTQAGFESRMRRQVVLQQLSDGVQSSVFVTDNQQEWLVRLMLEERRFEHAVLGAGEFLDQVSVDEAEIRQEYEANQQRYMTPERMKVEYVELSVDDLASDVSVSEEDIQQAYERNRNRFTTDAVRHASHILIEVDAQAGEEAQQAARQEAETLLEALRGGADFAELARRHSDDPGSAPGGGDLGRVAPGDMVEPFQEALFALDEDGALAGPVRTRFGYHIIKLTEYEPAEAQPIEQVRDQLVAEERARQAEQLFLDRAEAFRNISYEQPQSLEPVADQLDLEIRESQWFTRSDGSGIAANDEVREAAFGEEVYTDGLNSRAIELDMVTLVVVRRLDVQPASVKPLEEVSDEIRATLERRKAEQEVAALGPELVNQLEGGGDWQQVLAEHGLESRTSSVSRAQGTGPDGPHPSLVDAVFRAPEPGGGTPVFGGTAVGDGNYALFALGRVVQGDAESASEQLRQRVRDTLSRRRGLDMFEQYLADLRERAEVVVREEAL